jgi:hypothetical protein
MKTMKNTFSIALLIILSITFTTTVKAQMSPYKFNQLFQQAFVLVVEGSHREAMPILAQLYLADENHGQVSYLYGVCRLKMEAGNSTLTRKVLETASRNFHFKHQYGRVDDRSSPVKVWFYLAEANASENRVDKAIESYRNYMSCIQMASLNHKRMVKNRITELKQQKAAIAEEVGTGMLASLQR